MVRARLHFRVVAASLCLAVASCLLPPRGASSRAPLSRLSPLAAEQYRDPVTGALSRLLPSSGSAGAAGELVNAGERKKKGLRPQKLCSLLDSGLRKYSWFVTGRVDQTLFADAFDFVDPSVKVESIEDYARGVARLFDQETAKMDVVDCRLSDAGDAVLVCWRLEGRVNLPFKPRIKPFLVDTTLLIGEDGLIVAQEDVFQVPAWDILISTVIPGFGAPPAPPVA